MSEEMFTLNTQAGVTRQWMEKPDCDPLTPITLFLYEAEFIDILDQAMKLLPKLKSKKKGLYHKEISSFFEVLDKGKEIDKVSEVKAPIVIDFSKGDHS